METKTKNKNKNKSINRISFIIALFFALAQLSQANVVLSASISAGEMINLTNESRVEAGLPSLLVNEKLTEAAREKADDMFANQYFDHNSPNGLTPWDFIKSAEYDYRYAGENLAIDFVTANGAHKALMESSSHRENILNSNYIEIGIAAVEGIFDGNKSIIIVEEFGTPLEEKAVMDYDLNENIELIIGEKMNEISNLKDNNKEEKELEEFPQAVLPARQADSIQACLLDGQEHGANGLKEEGVNEQNDNLSLGDLNIYYSGRLAFLWTSSAEYARADKFDLENLCCSKSNETIIEHKPILLAGNLNNEKVMGLVNKAYAKGEYIRKYDYQQKSIGLIVDHYSQNEFIGRVLLFYAILAVLLIFDFVMVVYLYRKREE